MLKKILVASLVANLLLGSALALLIQRLGGVRYALHRFRHTEAGLYAHRKDLFEKMPVCPEAIIFLGDSQTEQCEWREWLQWGDSTPTILNRGITADHIAGIQARLPEVLRHQPSKIFLMAGVNDLLFGSSPPEVAGRIRVLVQTIRQQSPTTELILQTLPPVNNTVKKTGIENTVIQAFNAALALVAQEYSLPLVDLYTPLCDASGNLAKTCTDDGLHLNATGYQIWKNAVEEYR